MINERNPSVVSISCNTAAGVLLSCLSWCIDNTACGRVRVVYRAKQHSMTQSAMAAVWLKFQGLDLCRILGHEIMVLHGVLNRI